MSNEGHARGSAAIRVDHNSSRGGGATVLDDQRLELLDVAEAAAYLSTPVRFIRRLVAQRRIRFYKVGRYVRIDKADLNSFVTEGQVDAFDGAQR